MASGTQPSLLKPAGGVLHQLIRYGLSGGVASVVDMGVLWFVTSCLGMHYQIGAGCGYSCGLVITYLFSTLWVFDQHRTDCRWLEALGFAAIGLVGLGATHLLMWLFTEKCFSGDCYMISKLFTVIIVSLLNFTLKKYILFKR